ncbi:hypothetical protein M405DRAFT_835909 [Rhizopogon salebrosus TDB-379]|nr:hypothetical protein M405DRAFT_835909 [Rhizopogon salebrosus TDB-379]
MPRSLSGQSIRASTTADCIFDPGSHFPGRHKRRAYYYARRYWAILRGTFPFLRPESPLNQQSL